MTAKPPSRPIKRTVEATEGPEKPYALIPFPTQRPPLKSPIGHHRYISDGYHGTLHLTLKVKTALHVSTGVTALGSDVGSKVPLIKTMVQGKDQRLLIQGSSIKGCVRAIYEAITNSTLAVVTGPYRQQMPKDRLPCLKKESLCPASQVFGALDWQGLLHFADARCERVKSAVGFMPPLYRPRPAYFERGIAAGRKFYYHAVKALSGGTRGIPVQQAETEYTFVTQLHFKNLSKAQLGTLLVALGQDEQYPLTLKLGGGKPVGLGTVQVEVTSLEVMQKVSDRYSQYNIPTSNQLEGNTLKTFIQQVIQTAHEEKLVEEIQLRALSQVLQWPTTREAPSGMY